MEDKLMETHDDRVRAVVMAVVALLFDNPKPYVPSDICDHVMKVAVNKNLALCPVCRRTFTTEILAGITVSPPKNV